MIRRRTALISLAFLLYIVRTVDASDAKSWFAYMKEIAEPATEEEKAHLFAREGRQCSCSTCCSTLTFSLNGVTNFTFSVANIPTNFPIACGGDDRNYCNYPDLPLIETYDLNYFSRRPIPSGRCPDGYTKMPTFDCLNVAPALFETTCCVFMGTTVPDICSSSTTIDAMWTLCNGSVYIASGAYVWQYDQFFNYRAGPTMLAALSGGCISRDLSEAEVDGDCNVKFFNLADQYFTTDYATGSLSCAGPSLVTQLGITGTPNLVFNVDRGTTIYKIDGDGFQVALPTGYNFICGANQTMAINVALPGVLGASPLQNCSAASYFPSRDLVCFICNYGSNYLTCATRLGVLAITNTSLTGLLSNCKSSTTVVTGNQVAPIVYIPYPIYPVFMGQQSASPSSSYGSSPSSSSYSSSPTSSYSASPSASTSYGSSPSPSASPSSYSSAMSSPTSGYGKK